MPRIRPKPSLGGSAAVGGAWSDDRLDDDDAVRSLQVRPLIDDPGGWHAGVLDGNRVEIGRLAYVPGADPAGAWCWAVKHGARGYATTRAEALQALARSWAAKRR